MFRKFILRPSVWHEKPLEFEWDAEMGTFRGADAESVRARCKVAQVAGGLVSHPYPTYYPISDPFHRIEDLAVVLGQWWRLDDALRQAYPMFPPSGESDIPMLY